MLQAGGALLVQVLEDGKVVGPGIVFRIHRTHTNERMSPESRTQHKEIASIEQAPKPQRLTKPSELTVEGTFTDEATFTLTIALDEKGVTFKVAYDEPSRLPLPASLVPCIYILPSVDFQNKEQQEIDAETEGWEMKLSGPKLRGTYSFSQAMTGVPMLPTPSFTAHGGRVKSKSSWSRSRVGQTSAMVPSRSTMESNSAKVAASPWSSAKTARSPRSRCGSSKLGARAQLTLHFGGSAES